MAEPIPTVDPALLAAQAKAGQAGVDAYNAAIASMQQQRQTAVQSAMQEAALRGAPAGAAQSVQGQITGPYDQRIASLTQSGAAYQADLSARDRRLADYNAATQAARSYIPQQVEQQVAPIRARGEYDVRQEQVRGEQNVAGINADLQLQMARMAAAAQAAEIAAAKAAAAKKGSGKASKGEPINQTQLRSALTQQATADIQGASQQVEQAQSENAFRAQLGQVAAGAKRTVAQNTPEAAALAGRSYWDTMAAAYTGKAVQESQRTAAAAAAAPPPPPIPQVTIRPGRGVSSQFMLPTPPPAVPTAPQQQAAANTGAQAAAQQIAALQQRIAQSARPLKAIREQADVGYGEAMNQIRQQYTSQYGWVTPTQLGGMDPLAQWAVQNAPGRFSSGTSVERMLMGAPYQTGTGAYSGQPVLGTDPYAADVMRQAQILAAGRMQDQGYDITDADIYGALGTQGMSAYDASRELAGQPTAADEITADERDRALAESMAAQEAKAGTAAETAQTTAETARAQQNEDAARQIILQQKGRVPDSSYGTPSQILQALQDPAYAQAIPALDNAIAEIEDEGDQPTEQAINEKLRVAGIPSNVRRLLLQFEL